MAGENDTIVDAGQGAALMREVRDRLAVIEILKRGDEERTRAAQKAAQQRLNVYLQEQEAYKKQADAYLAQQERIRRAAYDASKAHDDFAGHVEKSEEAMSRFEKVALGFVGFSVIKNELTSLIHELIGLGSESESTQIALAGLFQANNAPGLTGPQNFTKAMDAAAEAMARIRKDARDLPGESSDLMNIFRPILTPALGSGRSIGETEAFAARMMAVSKTLQVDSQTAGRELSHMLMGRVGSMMPLWQSLKGIVATQADGYTFLNKAQREGLKDLEKVAKTWHTLSVDQRMRVVQSATEAMQPSIDRFAQTWEAISSTTEDYRKTIMRAMAGPVYEEAKKILSEINGYYEAHKEQIDQIAEALGDKLAHGMRDAFEMGKSLVSLLVENKDILLAVGQMYAIGRVTGALSTGAGGLLGALGPLGKGALRNTIFEKGNATSAELMGGYRDLGVGGTLRAFGGQMLMGGAKNIALAHLLGPAWGPGGWLDTSAQLAGDTIAGVTGALGQLPGPIGQVAGKLGVLYEVLNTVAKWVDDWQKNNINNKVQHQSLIDEARPDRADDIMARAEQLQDNFDRYKDLTRSLSPEAIAKNATAQRLLAQIQAQQNALRPDVGTTTAKLHDLGVYDAKGKINDTSLDEKMAQMGFANEDRRHIFRQNLERIASVEELLAATSALDMKSDKTDPGKKAGVNVNIYQTNNVYEADDPDRVRVVIKESLEDALLRPTHGGGLSSLARY